MRLSSRNKAYVRRQELPILKIVMKLLMTDKEKDSSTSFLYTTIKILTLPYMFSLFMCPFQLFMSRAHIKLSKL